jgi:hypothetical protein
MRQALGRRHGRVYIAVMFALAIVAIACDASAQQQACITLDDGPGGGAPILYRLNVTLTGNGTASVVGTASQGSARRVVTGGGAVIGTAFELSLQGTDFVAQTGDAPALVTHATHVTLNGPAFAAGTFKSVHTRLSEGAQSLTQTISLTDGTAAVIGCPPQG